MPCACVGYFVSGEAVLAVDERVERKLRDASPGPSGEGHFTGISQMDQ